MLKETKFHLPKVDNIVIHPGHKERTKKLEFLGYSPTIDETKNKISTLSHETWSKLRKLTNPLEYPYKHDTPKPISRAFFKFIELAKTNNIDLSGNTLHLCEAPGGFIQGLQYLLGKKDTHTHYAFSLMGAPGNPMFHRSIIDSENVSVLSNNKNGGNIYFTDNIKILIRTLADKNIRFITADGGFCETNDFANKEPIHHKIIFNQIVCALHILANNGCLLIKVFDIHTELTFDYLYLLSYLFEDIYIHKPNTSRPTNSERYVYCKNYTKRRFSGDLMNHLQTMCQKNINNLSSFVSKKNASKEFTRAIQSINRYLTDYQLHAINNILNIHRLSLKVNYNPSAKHEWINKFYTT